MVGAGMKRQWIIFTVLSIGLFLALAPFAGAIAEVQQAADPRVADLVRTGRIRVALHLAQYTKDPVTGELHGLGSGAVSVQIAHALAARLGIEVQLVGYPTPPAVVNCLRVGACDVGFVGIERAAEVGLSPPFLQLDYTYLVPAGSSIRHIADADQPGVRIAVVRNHLSTLALSRILKHVKPIDTEIPGAAFDLLRTGQADALASTRPVLLAYSAKLPDSRVLEDRYGANLVAMAVAKDQAGRLAYISEFIDAAKASGFVQRAIERVGERGIRVAPRDLN
jgi:polar amino acid transport system substrate-binding protein